MTLDSKEPTIPLEEYVYGENRYNVLKKTNPERSKELVEKAQLLVNDQVALYKYLAERKMGACEVAKDGEEEVKAAG